jgi:hypothetical protein
MENDEKPIISKEVSQLIGALFFIVIACPIIWVVLLANDIPIPDPRLIFWLSAITGIVTLFLLNLITMLLHILLTEQSFERLRSFSKKFSVGDLCFSFVETSIKRNNDKKFEAKLFFALLVAYLIAIRFVAFITWNK